MTNKLENFLTVRFKIFTKSIDLKTLTSELSVKPDIFYVKGEPIKYRKNQIHDENMWGIESKLSSISYEEHIQWILNKIAPIKKKILKRLASDEITCEFSCYFDNFEKTANLGFPIIDFTYKTLSEIVELRATLDIDIL